VIKLSEFFPEDLKGMLSDGQQNFKSKSRKRRKKKKNKKFSNFDKNSNEQNRSIKVQKIDDNNS